MINFRYHVVSLIAVFLSLAIGVIMGSAVIDRAIVNRLEDQQTSLEKRIKGVEAENDTLDSENRDLRDTAEQLAQEGSQRLLAGTLTGVPVVVIATRGVESDGFKDLLSLLRTSRADERGVLWLTERFSLDGDEEVRDLAAAIGAPATMGADELRLLALTHLSTMLSDVAASEVEDPSAPTTATTTSTTDPGASVEPPGTFVALRDSGFVDFDPPEGSSADGGPQLVAGTRMVFVSGASAEVAVDALAIPLAELLVQDRPDGRTVAVLAAEDVAGDGEQAPSFVVPLRRNDAVTGHLSTVDNIGNFAGRLAAVLAIVDLGQGRTGHYGTGSGAQRLLPAPSESP